MLIPCTLAMLIAVVVLAPPIGHLMVRPGDDPLWPPGWWESAGIPEPVEHGRYVLAVLAPALLFAAILWGSRHELKLQPRLILPLVAAGQAIALGIVAVGVLAQSERIFVEPDRRKASVFADSSLFKAVVIVAVAMVALRHRPLTEWLSRAVRETRARTVVGFAAAAVVASMWMLESVTTDQLVEDLGQLNWTITDAFAVLNGRTPFVDYHLLYGRLAAYLGAGALALFGTTAFVYTLIMAILSVLGFLCAYAVIRRVSRSSLLALGLFVPFVAMSGHTHISFLTAMWPMRYSGSYLVAWLTARHIDKSRPHRAWLLFLVAGVTTFNSSEFGLGAVVATFAALLCVQQPRTLRALRPLVVEAAAGLLGAVVLVSAFTFARAGALPSVTVLMEWPRVFTNLGWFSMSMPRASLHLVIYATFVASIAVAAVRLVRAADNVLLTSMLVWAGVLGLVASSYYAARSDDIKLLSMFSAWSFALTLLTIVSAEALAERDWRRPSLSQLAVLFGLALSILYVREFSLPQTHIDRLTLPLPDSEYRATAKRFIDARTRPGETVVLLVPEGYRIAHELGLRNVSPYAMQNAIVTRGQLQTVVETARREHARTIIVPQPGYRIANEGEIAPEQLAAYAREGFPRRSSRLGYVELRARRR